MTDRTAYRVIVDVVVREGVPKNQASPYYVEQAIQSAFSVEYGDTDFELQAVTVLPAILRPTILLPNDAQPLDTRHPSEISAQETNNAV